MYNRLSFNYYYAKKEFNDHGHKNGFDQDGDFKDFNLQYYLEYGISDKITLISALYYKDIKKENNIFEENTSGIGDIDVAAKYRLFHGSWGILSTLALVKIPETYDKNDPLPLGNGQYDFEIKLLYGRSLWPIVSGYFSSEAGYRFRTQDPADEFRYLIEIGMDFTEKAYGRVKLDGIEGMNNADNTDRFGANPSLAYNFDLGKLDMAFGYKLSLNWAVELGYTPEIYGKNTSAGSTYALALTYQFRSGQTCNEP